MSKTELDQYGLPVVDTRTHLDDLEGMSAVSANRFQTPNITVAMYRQGAERAIHKLLGVVESDEFDSLSMKDRLTLAEFFRDGAYGRPETALAAMTLAHKTGQGDSADHAKELEAIESRSEMKYPEFSRSTRALKDRRAATPPSVGEDESDPEPVADGPMSSLDRIVSIRKRREALRNAG